MTRLRQLCVNVAHRVLHPGAAASGFCFYMREPMQTDQANLYEQAFECFLAENKLPFVWIDQSKCLEYQSGPVKNFDFLVKPDSDSAILIELKGRTFKARRFALWMG